MAVEVYASYDPICDRNDSIVKGNVMFLDGDNNEIITDEDMYIDKYMFALYVIRRFWTSEYKWNSINISFKNRAVNMKGKRKARIKER